MKRGISILLSAALLATTLLSQVFLASAASGRVNKVWYTADFDDRKLPENFYIRDDYNNGGPSAKTEFVEDGQGGYALYVKDVTCKAGGLEINVSDMVRQTAIQNKSEGYSIGFRIKAAPGSAGFRVAAELRGGGTSGYPKNSYTAWDVGPDEWTELTLGQDFFKKLDSDDTTWLNGSTEAYITMVTIPKGVDFGANPFSQATTEGYYIDDVRVSAPGDETTVREKTAVWYTEDFDGRTAGDIVGIRGLGDTTWSVSPVPASCFAKDEENPKGGYVLHVPGGGFAKGGLLLDVSEMVALTTVGADEGYSLGFRVRAEEGKPCRLAVMMYCGDENQGKADGFLKNSYMSWEVGSSGWTEVVLGADVFLEMKDAGASTAWMNGSPSTYLWFITIPADPGEFSNPSPLSNNQGYYIDDIQISAPGDVAQKAAEFRDKVNALPSAADVTAADSGVAEAQTLSAALDGYTGLNERIIEAAREKLAPVSEMYTKRKQAADFKAAVGALPAADAVTLDDGGAIAAAEALDKALGDSYAAADQAIVEQAREKLTAVREAYDKRKNVKDFCDKVNALPAAADVTADILGAITEAEALNEKIGDKYAAADQAAVAAAREKLAAVREAYDALDRRTAGLWYAADFDDKKVSGDFSIRTGDETTAAITEADLVEDPKNGGYVLHVKGNAAYKTGGLLIDASEMLQKAKLQEGEGYSMGFRIKAEEGKSFDVMALIYASGIEHNGYLGGTYRHWSVRDDRWTEIRLGEEFFKEQYEYTGNTTWLNGASEGKILILTLQNADYDQEKPLNFAAGQGYYIDGIQVSAPYAMAKQVEELQALVNTLPDPLDVETLESDASILKAEALSRTIGDSCTGADKLTAEAARKKLAAVRKAYDELQDAERAIGTWYTADFDNQRLPEHVYIRPDWEGGSTPTAETEFVDDGQGGYALHVKNVTKKAGGLEIDVSEMIRHTRLQSGEFHLMGLRIKAEPGDSFQLAVQIYGDGVDDGYLNNNYTSWIVTDSEWTTIPLRDDAFYRQRNSVGDTYDAAWLNGAAGAKIVILPTDGSQREHGKPMDAAQIKGFYIDDIQVGSFFNLAKPIADFRTKIRELPDLRDLELSDGPAIEELEALSRSMEGVYTGLNKQILDEERERLAGVRAAYEELKKTERGAGVWYAEDFDSQTLPQNMHIRTYWEDLRTPTAETEFVEDGQGGYALHVKDVTHPGGGLEIDVSEMIRHTNISAGEGYSMGFRIKAEKGESFRAAVLVYGSGDGYLGGCHMSWEVTDSAWTAIDLGKYLFQEQYNYDKDAAQWMNGGSTAKIVILSTDGSHGDAGNTMAAAQTKGFYLDDVWISAPYNLSKPVASFRKAVYALPAPADLTLADGDAVKAAEALGQALSGEYTDINQRTIEEARARLAAVRAAYDDILMHGENQKKPVTPVYGYQDKSNLLAPYGSFETLKAENMLWDGVVAGGVGVNGGNALRIGGRSATWQGCGIDVTDILKKMGSGKYYMSASIKAIKAPTGISPGLRCVYEDGSEITYYMPEKYLTTAGLDWTQMGVTAKQTGYYFQYVTTEDGERIVHEVDTKNLRSAQLKFYGNVEDPKNDSFSDYYIDDIAFWKYYEGQQGSQETEDPIVSIEPVYEYKNKNNLLDPYGGFEKMEPGNRIWNGTVIGGGIAKEGRNCLLISDRHTGDYRFDFCVGVQDIIKAHGAGKYYYSCWLKTAQAGKTTTLQPILYYHDTAAEYWMPTITVTDEWTFFGVTYDQVDKYFNAANGGLPLPGNVAEFRFYNAPGESEYPDYYIDEMAFWKYAEEKPAPTPNTGVETAVPAALLGVGGSAGLLLLARNRKRRREKAAV